MIVILRSLNTRCVGVLCVTGGEVWTVHPCLSSARLNLTVAWLVGQVRVQHLDSYIPGLHYFINSD